jgi:hypothetical protein
MSTKAKAPEPQPRPTVGGSFTLNSTTGEWEQTSTILPVESVVQPEPITATETPIDGTDA